MTSAHRFDEPLRKTPELHAGDRLTRAEFHRRYEAMDLVGKAELLEGVVYMPSPVRSDRHGEPHLALAAWLGHYVAYTPGVHAADNATVLLDEDNEPQPDLTLRIDPLRGGQTTTENGYIRGAPELAIEVTASTASYDLHDKKTAYRRNGVREYLVWRVEDRELDWFVLREGRYDRLAPGADGVLRSGVFPGLWLDAAALLRGDAARVLEVGQAGLDSPEHRAFAVAMGSG